MNLKTNKNDIIAIFLIIAIASWQLLIPGYFSVHDDMHPAWIYEMTYAIKHFQFPPRWAAHLSWGFGYPLFTFIYPLPYYLGSILNFLGFNLTDSVKWLHIIAFALSAVFMWQYARKWGRAAGLICAVLYTFAPYRAVVTYVRGALGEAWVFVFIPLILWRVDEFSRKPNLRNIALLALSSSLFLLTHNIAVLMFFPLLAAYAVFKFIQFRVPFKEIVDISFAILFAVSYFWIPALIYKSQMIDDPIYSVADHFPFLKQLIVPSWGYGASLWGPDDGFSFQIGIGLLTILGLGLFILINKFVKTHQIDQKLFMLLISIAAVLFIMNIRSLFIWQIIPFMNYFQFPWRWLMVVVVILPITAGYVFSRYKSKSVAALLSVSIAISLGFSFFYFQPHDRRPITDQDIRTRFFPVDPETISSPISQEYVTLTEEYLRLPKNSVRPQQLYPVIQLNPLDQFISTDFSNPFDLKAQIQKKSTGPILIRRYFLPEWQVKVNNHKPVTQRIPPHNNIGILIPPGDYSIRVLYKDPLWVSVLNYLSGLTFLFLFTVILWSHKKPN